MHLPLCVGTAQTCCSPQASQNHELYPVRGSFLLNSSSDIFFQVCSWDLHLLLSHLAFIPQPAPCSLGRSVGRQGRSPFPTSPPAVMAKARRSIGDTGSKHSTAQHGGGHSRHAAHGFPSLCDGSTGAEPSHPLSLNAESENKGKSTGKWAAEMLR